MMLQPAERDIRTMDIAEKRVLIAQMILDAVTHDDVSLLHALLGPCVLPSDNAKVDDLLSQIEEHEVRMYSEEIRQRLYKRELEVIKNYKQHTQTNDMTAAGLMEAINGARQQCKLDLMASYKDRILQRLNMRASDLDKNPAVLQKLHAYESTLDAIFKANLVRISDLAQLPECIKAIKEKLAYSEEHSDTIVSEARRSKEAVTMDLMAVQGDIALKREQHKGAMISAYRQKARWELSDETLRELSEEEFEQLVAFNLEQEGETRVTVSNCRTSDQFGNTLLHLAFYNRSEAVATLLVKCYGADMEARNLQGKTPKEFAKLEENDPFMSVVRYGERQLTGYLAEVARHLAEYKRAILDAGAVFKFFYHGCWHVDEKHAKRVEQYDQLMLALKDAQQHHHDSAVNEALFKLLREAGDAETSSLFKGMLKAYYKAQTGELVTYPRSLRRIDSASATQDVALQDAYREQATAMQVLQEDRDELSGALVQQEADHREVVQGKDDALQRKDGTIATLSGELQDKVGTIATLSGELQEKDSTIAKQSYDIDTLRAEHKRHFEQHEKEMAERYDSKFAELHATILSLQQMLQKLQDKQSASVEEPGGKSPTPGMFG